MGLASAATMAFAAQPDLLDGLIRGGTERAFGAGDLLMRQDDASSSFFYILSGRVAIERTTPDLTGPLTLAELGHGELVGEMGVLDGRTRSATVRAIEPTRAIEVGRDAALEALAGRPETALRVMQQLVERLRATDDIAAKSRP